MPTYRASPAACVVRKKRLRCREFARARRFPSLGLVRQSFYGQLQHILQQWHLMALAGSANLSCEAELSKSVRAGPKGSYAGFTGMRRRLDVTKTQWVLPEAFAAMTAGRLQADGKRCSGPRATRRASQSTRRPCTTCSAPHRAHLCSVWPAGQHRARPHAGRQTQPMRRRFVGEVISVGKRHLNRLGKAHRPTPRSEW
jgi:hypothetical protein